jgi:hypothetical protein
MHSATHCYVAKRDGEPGAYAACVDAPEYAKDTAKFIADIVKEGGHIERVTIEDSGPMLKAWMTWKKSRRDAASSSSSTEEKP